MIVVDTHIWIWWVHGDADPCDSRRVNNFFRTVQICARLVFAILLASATALCAAPLVPAVDKIPDSKITGIDGVVKWSEVKNFLQTKPKMEDVKLKFGEPLRAVKAGENAVWFYSRKDFSAFPDTEDIGGFSVQFKAGKVAASAPSYFKNN